MNIEPTKLDMILNHLETTSLEPHDDYTSEFTYKSQKILYRYILGLQQENQQLKELTRDIDMWNNMYNEEFDKNRKSKETIDKAIEYIDKNMEQRLYTGEQYLKTYDCCTDLLQILEDKEV